MMRKTSLAMKWLGGTAAVTSMGSHLYDKDVQRINVMGEATRHAVPTELRNGVAKPHAFGKFNRNLRADIYDELLKLPLRYQLHKFDDIQEAHKNTLVGYAPPMGAADLDDTIPFHVHRNRNGRFNIKMYSLDPKMSLPSFFLRLDLIDGDLHRFEEELIKIFPTKKTFVRDPNVVVFNLGQDGVMILNHWFIGLGF